MYSLLVVLSLRSNTLWDKFKALPNSPLNRHILIGTLNS